MRATVWAGGVVGLVAVGLRGVSFGLSVAAALDFFGQPGLGGGDALVGAGAGGVYWWVHGGPEAQVRSIRRPATTSEIRSRLAGL
jgi:hypothetical protein